MRTIIKLFGVLFIVVGIWLLFAQLDIFNWLENNLTQPMLYYSVILIRLILGVLLIMAAKGSRFPRIIKILGYVAVVAALVMIFMGKVNFYEFFSAVIPKVKPFAPLSGLVGIGIGVFLIYAFSRKKTEEIDQNSK